MSYLLEFYKLLEKVWDYRHPREKNQTKRWRRNEYMFKAYKKGSSYEELSKKYNLSINWTRIIVAREKRLHVYLADLPDKKVVVSDMGPFSFRLLGCLTYENLIYLTIEEFYQSQDAQSLLRIPNFGNKSLHEIALCLKREGYDITKFTRPGQKSLSWIGKE